MSSQAVYKDDKSKLGRLGRLIASIFHPGTYAQALRILNYYRYSHSAELAKAIKGTDLRISPTASFANGQNIELGDHVRIGANVSIWAGPGRGRIKLGAHTMIAPNTMLTAANYRFGDGSPVNEQAMDEGDIVTGRDVWIGANVVVLPGVTIGDGAIIGAGAVIRQDVAAWSIVVGSASQVIGRRFAPDAAGDRTSTALADQPSADVRAWLLRQEGLSEERIDAPIDACGIDSFGLISLRAAIEQDFGRMIPDQDWAALEKLADIARFALLAQPAGSITQATPQVAAAAVQPLAVSNADTISPQSSSRSFALNMPQMALAGLSESWMVKEIGDVHWAMITRFLGTASGAITDQTGSRLYATFTRIRFDAEPSLRSFKENDTLNLASRLERFGGSFFFGQHDLVGPGATVRARTMSTFAKYGERGKNTSLMKGTPNIPDPSQLPSLSDFPDFGTQYRERRAREDEGEALFECDYDQLGPHDINGVGLLYFAAYPIIFDICLARFEGAEFLLSHSTTSKDVCYFANAEPTETLVFRLTARKHEDDLVHHIGTLSRKSDGKRMAEIHSVKRHVGIHVPQ